MTADLLQSSEAAQSNAAGRDAPRPRKPCSLAPRLGKWAAVALAMLVAMLIVVGVVVRYAAETNPGRAAITRLVNGIALGSIGRLRVEGLQGDVFGRFRLGRLSIVDATGTWLDASDVAVAWRPSELMQRRVHAELISAAAVRVLRRPVLTTSSTKPGPSPVSVTVDALRLRLQTLPQFSVRQGDWDVAGALRLARNGSGEGRIRASSRLHQGDGGALEFRLGEDRRVMLKADAVEALGGALAGGLGLAADQRLAIRGRADGTTDAGELNLVAVSGAQTPLSAVATWSPAGGSIDGHVQLSASRLTAFFAARAGPEAHLILRARRTQGDTYTLVGEAVAKDASASLDGTIDWRARRSAGLNLKLQVADLSSWLPFPRLGAAHSWGVVTGDLGRFTYKGGVDGQRLTWASYGLARVFGPATLIHEPGEWRFQADLSSLGGVGEGVVPTLLGRAPTARVDLSRLAGGRILFRALDIAGPGLRLNAVGGRELLGGLSFKGSATVSGLEGANPGAHGIVNADWSAHRANDAQAWSVALDARAMGFSSGVRQLDHLVGATPRLTGDGTYGPLGLSVAHASLEGGALQLTTRGVLNPSSDVSFDVDWRAKGPFDVGPITIAGQASGTGRLSGTLIAPHVDLGAELASIDLGPLRVTPAHLKLSFDRATSVDGRAGGYGGQVDLTGGSHYGAARARAAFRFFGQGLELSGIDADAGGLKAVGAIALRDGAPSTADLNLDVRAGAFLSTGRLGGKVKLLQQAGVLTADLALDGQDLTALAVPGDLRKLRLRAQGPWAKLPFQVSAEAATPLAWNFDASGVLAQTGAVRRVELSGQGRVRNIVVKTLEPATVSVDGPAHAVRLRLLLGGGRVDLDASEGAQGLDAKASLRELPMAAFDQDLVGALSGAGVLAGRGAALGGTLDAILSGARSRDAPANLALDGHVHALLDRVGLHIAAGATNAQGLKSQLDVSLPTDATAEPFHFAVDRTRPMQGSFSADGELRPLWDLLIGGEQTLSGHVVAGGVLAGTLAEPRASGQVSLTAGRLQDVVSGLNLQNLSLQADFGRNLVQIRQAAGADGRGGSMSGSGAISLLKDGGSTFALKLTRFRLFDNDIGRASASGELTVSRDAKGQAKLAGALRVDRADIVAATPTPNGVAPLDVVEIHKPVPEGEPSPPPSLPPAPPFALDVSINAPRGVFVRGRGLNVELSLDAHVKGTVAKPDLTGTANVVLGSYDFAGKRFDFDQRGSVRLATHPEAIRLDLTARRQDPTLTAVVTVTGTAARPEISLSSTPVLPQDEVLSQVLFGSSTAQLAPAQAAELASALASLAGGGGFDILGRLRQFAGLDRLALGAGTSGTGVAGGKYIGDSIYVELTGGGREGPTAAVEWRVRKNFSVVSQVGTQGDAQLSIQFRKSY